MKLSFRRKIFLSYFVIFLSFLLLMSPFSSFIIVRLVEDAMEKRSREIIEQIDSAPNNEGILRKLKEIKPYIFFRITVITDEKKVLYDSHTKRLLGPRFSQEHVVDDKEVLEALEKGVGYSEEYSDILEQKFAYTAVAFDFHGKKYVLRSAFPEKYVKEIKSDFEMGFILLSSFVLILFALITWFVINYFTKPIQRIISAVNLYREGEQAPLKDVKELSKTLGGNEDVGNLAYTLVSLADQVDNQIKTLKEERNEKEMLLESLTEGVIAVDPFNEITFVNEAACRFLGKTKDELMGGSLSSQGLEKATSLISTSKKSNAPLIDSLKISKENVPLFLDIIAIPKQDMSGAVLVLIDQTPHHKILEMRKEFIANASHELKTPITIIRGFAETLYDNPELPEEMTKSITEKIVKNCSRMELLIKDLLALADIESLSKSRLETFNLIEMLERIKTTVLELFNNAKIEIKPLDPIEIEADPYLLEMALFNLVQNGAKYSENTPEVTIDLKALNDKVELKISDKGIGIPENELKKIFERFYRVNKTHAQKVPGSGLGLSIVENVIKKLHGKISVKSKLGEGTTFTVLLPLKQNLG